MSSTSELVYMNRIGVEKFMMSLLMERKNQGDSRPCRMAYHRFSLSPLNEMAFIILRRTLWALPPTLLCGYCVRQAFGGSGFAPEIAAWLLFAAAMLIVFAIQMAFPIAGMIGDWISRIYMPAGSEIPPASYILADRYEKEHRWGQSMTEFQKIIGYHPDEMPAHLGRLRVAIHGFGDGKLAKKFLRASLRNMRDPESQETLRMEWEKLMAEAVQEAR